MAQMKIHKTYEEKAAHSGIAHNHNLRLTSTCLWFAYVMAWAGGGEGAPTPEETHAHREQGTASRVLSTTPARGSISGSQEKAFTFGRREEREGGMFARCLPRAGPRVSTLCGVLSGLTKTP